MDITLKTMLLTQDARNLDELLFGMVILGDDRLVEQTHIATQA